MLNLSKFPEVDMGEAVSTGSELDLSKPITDGKKREDGHWTDFQGISLPVSASDLERHTYCPVSWQLWQAGISGDGAAL